MSKHEGGSQGSPFGLKKENRKEASFACGFRAGGTFAEGETGLGLRSKHQGKDPAQK